MTKVGLLSLGSSDFNMDIATKYLKETNFKLNSYDIEVVSELQVIDTEDQLNIAIKKFKESAVDLLVIQLGTFFMGDLCVSLIKNFEETPFFLWGVREPIDPDSCKIELNSWTGLNMFTSFLKRFGKKFSYVYGDIGESDPWKKLSTTIKAIEVKRQLKSAKFGVIGSRVPGFYLSEVNHLNFQKKVGPAIEYYSIASVKSRSDKILSERVEEKFKKISTGNSKVCVSKENMEKNIRLYLALKDLCREEGLDGLSIKCWPEFQELYGMVVCSAVSMLTDDGIMTSCEGDIPGLATMYIQYILAGEIPFFTDLVDFTSSGIVKAWHCGQGPAKLSAGEVCYCNHPTYEDDFPSSVQYGMKLGKLTMSKLSEMGDQIRVFSSYGESIKPNKYIDGIQTDMVFEKPMDEMIETIVENGIEHHFSIVHKDIKNELIECCKWMGWEYIE